MSNTYERVQLKPRRKARRAKALVILSWGADAWYRDFPLQMSVGELRRQLAKELGRIFAGNVIGLELIATGTGIAPDLSLPLQALTHPPYRNVCLDVTAGPRRATPPAIDSIGECLLRKHLRNERFQCGLAQHLWRLIQLDWPVAVFAIGGNRNTQRCETGLRFNLARYPLAPPLVELWDLKTQAAIEAERWTEPFIRFASQNYPQFIELKPAPSCSNLLRVSIAVADRLSRWDAEEWDVNGDVTQTLARASGYFRNQHGP